jgi:hypothetical protein
MMDAVVKFLLDSSPTLFGTFVGFGLVVLWDRRKERKRRKSERQNEELALRQEEAAILRTMVWIVSENTTLGKQILDMVTPTTPASFDMNAHIIDEFLPRLSQLSDDQQIVVQLEHYRYQLHHLNNKLRRHRRELRQTSSNMVRENNCRTVIAHVSEMLHPSGKNILKKMRERLNTHAPSQIPPLASPHWVTEKTENTGVEEQ